MRISVLALLLAAASCSSDSADAIDAAPVDLDAGTSVSIDASPPMEETDARPALSDAMPAQTDAMPAVSDASPGGQDATPGAQDAALADAGGLPAADANIGPDATSNSAMSFFATSVGTGASGGNLGGLAGADAKCQALAANAGAGNRTWRAYLSTGALYGPGPVVDARDRIGTGPWANFGGTQIAASVADLHTNGLASSLILDEFGNAVPSSEHDILTGSSADGTLDDDFNTCANWTDGSETYQRTVGHTDADDNTGDSWNAIHTGACDQAAILAHSGSGRTYCFAID